MAIFWYTVKSWFKKDLNLQIHLHKFFCVVFIRLNKWISPQSDTIRFKKRKMGLLKLRFACIKTLPNALKFYIVQFNSRIFFKSNIKWVLMILWWCTYIIANVNREVLVQNWLFERGMNNENTNSFFKAQSVEREKLHHIMCSTPFWSCICTV